MDLENTPKPTPAEIAEIKSTAVRAFVRRIAVAAGIALVVSLFMTWLENRNEANSTLDTTE